MVQITYQPTEAADARQFCEVFGLTFIPGQALEVAPDFPYLGKLRGNPQFEVEDDEHGGAHPAPPTAPQDPGLIPIVQGWDELGAPEMRALAAQIAGKTVANKADAVVIIEGELARRAAEQAVD